MSTDIAPNSYAQARALEQAGRWPEAETAYAQLLKLGHVNDQVLHSLGFVRFQNGKSEQAIADIQSAIAMNGRVAMYHRNLGEIYRRCGEVAKAIASGKKATLMAPSDVDAHYNLGLAYADQGNNEAAVEQYKKALGLRQGHAPSWNNLGSSLGLLGHQAQALEAYQRAIAIEPRNAQAHNNAGAIYLHQGNIDAARQAFEAAVHAQPPFIDAHYNLSSLKTYQRDEPQIAVLAQLFQRRETLNSYQRVRLGFAYGKAMEDIKEFDRAFEAYEFANSHQHALMPVDEEAADRVVDSIIATFTKEFFAARRDWPGENFPGKTPIFIVGMPRSGTSLLEQVLASYPGINGAGELRTFGQLVNRLTGAGPDGAYAEGATALSKDDVKQLGEAYLQEVWRGSPDSDFVTDKMPSNFFYLGLIHLALPAARIIHATRDPMDSCFSCYSRLFNETMNFTFELRALGRYYARYARLMEHWRSVLPQGALLNLAYEDMVSETEVQAKRALEFIGLPWNPACLEFHANPRVVRTASNAQVRKPVYQTSVARWKPFARHLQPLHEIVSPFRAPDDMTATMNSLPAPPERKADTSLGLLPSAAEAAHIEGVAHYKAERFEKALACLDRTISLKPDFANAYNTRGFLLQDLGRLEDALADFRRAVELSPDSSMSRLNLGMLELKLGRYEPGWQNYEARWTGAAEYQAGHFKRPECSLPVWEGVEASTSSADKSRSILVITEQGFGDTFQFSRYLHLLTRRFGKVGFACSEPTRRLVDWSFGQSVVSFTRIPAPNGWDVQCPLMSLPRAFGTTLESIPNQTPYLAAAPMARKYWRGRLEEAAPAGLRIGLAWAGRPQHHRDARRSLKLAQLAPLLADKRVTWVSLQKWSPEDVRPDIPSNVRWVDWTDELGDFADTAALVAELDLVISVDSAMVHLAGGLGRKVWMLDRFDNEWRWLSGREDSPWYPSMRIFRQATFAEWSSVIERMAGELAHIENPRAHLTPSGSAVRAQGDDVERVQPDAAAKGLSIEHALQHASQFQNAGRLREAEQVLSAILQAKPGHAHALHMLGLVSYQAGDGPKAIGLIQKAIDASPNEAMFHSNIAEMSRQLGRLPAALQHGERAVALSPSMASAHSNLGIAYFDACDDEKARQCHEKALELEPRMANSLNNLGSIARREKNREEAASWYKRALECNPDYLEAASNLGAVLVELNRHDEAVEVLERALAQRPKYPEALCNLGLARLKQQRATEAEGLLRRSLQLQPGYPEAIVGLARALMELDAHEEAFSLMRDLLHRMPEKADAWFVLGTLHVELERPSEADVAFSRALALQPDYADALIGLGNIRLEQGKLDDSASLLKAALAIDPGNIGARFHLVQVHKVKPDDANLAALEEAAKTSSGLSDEQKVSLHYALGKAYDDLKDWDRAFPHFMEGARLKRSKLTFSAHEDAERTRRIESICNAEFIERMRGAGDPSNVPIFVLGMPRSGTTLTEQIIASHPEVYGAGELRDLMGVLHHAPGAVPPGTYPERLLQADKATLTAWGSEYVRRLRARAPNAMRITDKMPANYFGLGMIPLMFPNAKIIHVKRNPADTCVSCYTRLFNKHQEATYDLHELGLHYANYARLMQHWRRVLPDGAFLEVQYEDIVADMEGQARRLIDWCGLEWDDACLDFHKTERSVRTASVAQVRQPIYGSSVERWRHYETYLEPLLNALGEFSPSR